MSATIPHIHWTDGALRLLDQRRLPHEVEFVDCHTAGEVAQAIRQMVVRGAPAIGITAAYAVALAADAAWRSHGAQWRTAIAEPLAVLAAARPTAVNLHWALARMQRCMAALGGAAPGPVLAREAAAIHAEDIAANRRIGEFGAALIAPGSAVITICNTGTLATGGYGTALGVIRAAHAAGTLTEVFACETRPWLQGARLTMWELQDAGIPATLIADGAAAALMQRRHIAWVIAGADRIAVNGDAANKIGTYGLAVLARAHGVRCMIAAPTSTIDPDTGDGSQIPVEERGADELVSFRGLPVAPPGSRVWNPVFDVTPAGLIDAIVTEHGVVEQPARHGVRGLLRGR
jgi:methylthioribose-1-phosphate isomerase